MLVEELLVALKLDSTQYDKGMNAAERKAGTFNNALSGLAMVGGGFLNIAFKAAAAGAFALGAGLIYSTKAASDAENIQAQLQAVLTSTGGVAGVTADQVNDLASSLAGLTPFEDEAIIGAENLLLTFTNIGKDVFPQATETVLDMSQALGQDLKSSAIQLGKALNNPVEGVTALQRVGVNFTDAQRDMIEEMVKAGRVEEAQIFILKELQTEFGGSAKAAGKTFAGQLTILRNKLGDAAETVGNALLPKLTELATMFNEYLSRPETLAFIQMLADKLAAFAGWAIAQLPTLFYWIKTAFGWLADNQGVIVAAIAAIGVAIAAFVYTTVIPAAVAAVSALWPILLIMAAVALVAYVAYQAWQANFGGIQQIVKRAGAFLLDMFFRIRFHLANAIPKAIEALKKIWETKFLPPIMQVYKWLQQHFFPLINALAGVLNSVFKLAIIALAAAWQKYLYPALVQSGQFLRNVILPVMVALGKFIAVSLVGAVINLGKAFDWLTKELKKVQYSLDSLELPAWLTPGSPTPLEIGVQGITAAMRQLQGVSMPTFQTQTPAFATAGATATRTINLTIAAKDVTREQVIKLMEDREESMIEALIRAIGDS